MLYVYKYPMAKFRPLKIPSSACLLQGNAVYSSIGDQEYTPSVIATIDTMIIENTSINFEQMSKPFY